MGRRKKTEVRNEAFRILTEVGWTDTKIARAFCVSSKMIFNWRKRAGVATSYTQPSIDEQVARRLHSEGASDGEIARQVGVTQSGATRWRQRRGLPANHSHNREDIDKRKIRKMLKLGASRQQVADEVGCNKKTVQRYRDRLNSPHLRPTGITNKTIANRVRQNSALMGRIKRAVGNDGPSHILEDAVLDLYTDVFQGLVAVGCIEQAAPSYRNRAFNMCGSKFGPVSLEAEDENGLRLIDLIADVSDEEQSFLWDR